MTDEELSQLLDEVESAVDECHAAEETGIGQNISAAKARLAAARAAIHAYFERHKSGEGGEDARDAARYRWLRDESANSVLGPFVMSAGPGMYGWIEGERTDAQVDAARTEGKGNG